MSLSKKILFLLFFFSLIYAGYLLVLLSIPYLTFLPDIDFLKTKQLIHHLKHWKISFYTHVFSSGLLFFCGLFQFIPYIFKHHKKLHRFLGKIYILDVVLISGPSAFIMSLYANGSYPAQISFVLLSFLWIYTTIKSYLTIRKKDFISHQNWAIRSFALTLSAVTLRFYAYTIDVLQINSDPVTTYIFLAWCSWIPNLLIAEIIIRKKIPQKYFPIN
jgi:hypothetical protein